MARPQTVSEDMILDAANSVIAREGPDSFTLAAVAREVGLTRAAIAFRFDNAGKLKLMAFEDRCERFERAMHGLDLGRGGQELLTLAKAIGAMARSPRDFLGFMATSQANLLDTELLAIEQRLGKIMREAIARVMPLDVPDPAGAVDMFAAHLTGSLIAWAASNEPNGERFLEQRTRVWLTMTGIPFEEPGIPLEEDAD